MQKANVRAICSPGCLWWLWPLQITQPCATTLQLHFPLLSSFASLSRVTQLQFRGGKSLFGLQFHVTAHHFGEVRAGIRAANRIHDQVLKAHMHTLACSSRLSSLLRSLGTAHTGLRLPQQQRESNRDMPTGKPDVDYPSVLTLFPEVTLDCVKWTIKADRIFCPGRLSVLSDNTSESQYSVLTLHPH